MIIICAPIPVESMIASSAQESTEIINVDCGYLEGRKREDGFEVTRLISTDPRAYLDNRFSPGSIYKNR